MGTLIQSLISTEERKVGGLLLLIKLMLLLFSKCTYVLQTAFMNMFANYYIGEFDHDFLICLVLICCLVNQMKMIVLLKPNFP